MVLEDKQDEYQRSQAVVLDQLYAEFSSLVFGLAYVSCLNQLEAQKICSVVFTDFLADGEAFSGDQAKLLLIRTTCEKALVYPLQAEFHSSNSSPDLVPAFPHDMLTVLEKLSTRERQVFHLYYIEELSLEALAGVFETSPDRVRSWLDKVRLQVDERATGFISRYRAYVRETAGQVESLPLDHWPNPDQSRPRSNKKQFAWLCLGGLAVFACLFLTFYTKRARMTPSTSTHLASQTEESLGSSPMPSSPSQQAGEFRTDSTMIQPADHLAMTNAQIAAVAKVIQDLADYNYPETIDIYRVVLLPESNISQTDCNSIDLRTNQAGVRAEPSEVRNPVSIYLGRMSFLKGTTPDDIVVYCEEIIIEGAGNYSQSFRHIKASPRY